MRGPDGSHPGRIAGVRGVSELEEPEGKKPQRERASVGGASEGGASGKGRSYGVGEVPIGEGLRRGVPEGRGGEEAVPKGGRLRQ